MRTWRLLKLNAKESAAPLKCVAIVKVLGDQARLGEEN